MDEELEGSSPEVIVQVGVNGVGRRCSEKIVKDYSCPFRGYRKRGSLHLRFSTRLWATTEWYSRALRMSSRVGKMYKELGLNCVHAWDIFYGKRRFLRMDGMGFTYLMRGHRPSVLLINILSRETAGVGGRGLSSGKDQAERREAKLDVQIVH